MEGLKTFNYIYVKRIKQQYPRTDNNVNLGIERVIQKINNVMRI
jgi:hypothetical protein